MRTDEPLVSIAIISVYEAVMVGIRYGEWYTPETERKSNIVYRISELQGCAKDQASGRRFTNRRIAQL